MTVSFTVASLLLIGEILRAKPQLMNVPRIAAAIDDDDDDDEERFYDVDSGDDVTAKSSDSVADAGVKHVTEVETIVGDRSADQSSVKQSWVHRGQSWVYRGQFSTNETACCVEQCIHD